ncbi:MAG TPA: tyrosine-protein kinase family protein [Gemmatimonadetes bacterium]|nr:tyrosine-protein kinase family protein [Gemmatimonadota bacterium]
MNLMFLSTDDAPIQTLVFSSPGPNEGKSTTFINFAVMLAQQGQRVLLIDADLRRPALHKAMDLLRFCAEVYEEQAARGALFLHERPLPAQPV